MLWFETWFNSKYYHLLYNNRNDAEAQNFIDNLIAYLQPKPQSKMLDLACGKGRHAKYLAEKGFDVCGIDLSPNSIAEAQKNETENLHFYEHDMRHIFRVNYFDTVFSFFTSMGYFEKPSDDEKQFKAMQAAVKAGGSLVIDFMNVKVVLQKMKPFQKIERENVVFEIEKLVANGFINKTTKVIENGELKMTATEKVNTFGLPFFEKILTKNGMKIENIFGDYQLNKFNENESERLIIHDIKK